VLSNFALSGMLVFLNDVSGADAKGLDLFSYGTAATATAAAAGLGFGAYNIAMTTTIGTDKVGHVTSIGPDLSQFLITPTSKPRDGSLVSALPLKLTAFDVSPDFSGWPVTFEGQSSQAFAADYALQFQVSLGSLGSLSSISDSLNVDFILGWQIGATDGDPDQLWLLMVPPKTMLGQQGFGIEGVLDTTFNSLEVVADTWKGGQSPTKVYAVRFKDVQVVILGISLIPDGGDSDFTLFADPTQGNASNMGWLMTLKQVSREG
jgi:hypothetical protein